MLKGRTVGFAREHYEAAHDGTIPNAKTFEMLDFSAPWTKASRLDEESRTHERVTALAELRIDVKSISSVYLLMVDKFLQ